MPLIILIEIKHIPLTEILFCLSVEGKNNTVDVKNIRT
jgi:hypothetical protein